MTDDIPAEWRECEQLRILHRWLAVRCPQGSRRKTDKAAKAERPRKIWPIPWRVHVGR